MLDIVKPGRYINKEWNSVHKEWTIDLLKFGLCFPDIYEIGMSHIGMKILYGILNVRKDVVCERFFAPWCDMEKKMRRDNILLRSLENGRQLKDFDVIGFSLQYEMNLVDVLNMLDLGGVSVRAKDREDNCPLVIAGGHCAFNPEPMADFIDAFVIGEAEEVVLEIVDLVQGSGDRVQGSGWRWGVLKELAKVQGVYVPALEPQLSALSVKKRIIKDIDNSYFPTNIVVPYIQIVHDRIGIEIMRGCPHNCKFCQACNIFRPFRIRSVKRILEIAEESVRNTGYEEISLLSLSTGDYPYIEELIYKLEERFNLVGVRVSLPSIRVRSFGEKEMGRIVKKRTLTFAPETGSNRLREYLGKNMDNEDIIQKSKYALKTGWKKIKLYFMIGLPGETERDLDSMVELALEIRSVHLSISPFIPKPHSEFERDGMDALASLREKERYIRIKCMEQGRNRNLRVDFHNPEKSVIEAILSRGDRKIAGVIYNVWKKGAMLQAWDENFDYNLWERCFQECGVDPVNYLEKKDKGIFLPWDFIIA